MLSTIKTFLHRETTAGIILFFSAVLAILWANSPFSGLYSAIFDTKLSITIGGTGITKPLLLWINDGFMAVFFFLVGLELKREIVIRELADKRKLALPLFGAIGGMAIPALVYFLVNKDNPEAIKGWAIPAATDIAFALGVLALLGKRVPLALKVFLVSLAIIDDIGVILIISLFYTENLSINALIFGLPILIGLFTLNKKGVTNKAPYILLGIILWVAVLKSGVHATLAGIAVAMFIPLKGKKEGASPLRELEHALHPWVAFMILPIFALANSGISLDAISKEAFLSPIPLGITLGLFIGKQVGVFAFSFAAIKLGFASLPDQVRWSGLYGVSLLTGIGFTMSLFIGSLAFEETGNVEYIVDDRLGIILGSALSAICGYLVLKLTLKDTKL